MALPTNFPNPNEKPQDPPKSQGLPSLPPTPKGGLPVPPTPTKPTNGGLPKLPLPNVREQSEQPTTLPVEKTLPTMPTTKSKKPSQPPKPERRRKQPKVADDLPEGYQRDPKTGKVYRLLPGASKEAIAAAKRNGGGFTSISDMRAFVKEQEDFDLDDLNSMANQFMAHLRVPPDKDELERLRKEREERLRKDRERDMKENPDLYVDPEE